MARQEALIATIPQIVPTRNWYFYNTIILVASLALVYLSSLILEYEFAKFQNPSAIFLPTPFLLDVSFSLMAILLGLANLAVLVFIFIRQLESRQWMVATTMVGWVLLAILALVLGDNFLPIMFP